MAYFNDFNHASLYSSASGGLYSHPSPSQTFAIDTEGAYGQIYGGPADQWSMVRQSGPMVGPPTSLRATDSFESVAPTTSYTSRHDGYNWPSSEWLADYHQAQFRHSGYLSRGGSFESTVSETSTAVDTPSSGEYRLEELGAHQAQTVPFNYWGANRSGAFTSIFDVGNANTSHWPMIGPTRAETTHTGRYQPYGVSRARPDRYGNAEAGLSTLVAPPVPYIGLPTTRPSGGISETTADAKQTKKFTEEHRAPRQKPKKPRLHRGEGKLRLSRVRTGGDGHRLRQWVRQMSVRRLEVPTLNQALGVAVWIIREKRSPVYPKPCLKTRPTERTEIDSKNANNEYERRSVERRLYRRLSRYYKVSEEEKEVEKKEEKKEKKKKEEWTRPQLLVTVLKDLDDLWACGELEELGDFEGFWDNGGLESLWDHEDIEDLKEYLKELESNRALLALPEPSIESPS